MIGVKASRPLIPFGLALALILSACSSTPTAVPDRPCTTDEARQKARSEELRKLAQADQEDHQDHQKKTAAEIQRILSRDLQRRTRVSEIFAEGCIQIPEDYGAAALIFQHGDVPDHYLQAFYWAKRGVEKGDRDLTRIMAVAIDRYLINTNHRQLFGSQAGKASDAPDACWCLEPVENSFPDELRRQYLGRNYQDALNWVKGLNGPRNCPAEECSHFKVPSPRGTVPGFW